MLLLQKKPLKLRIIPLILAFLASLLSLEAMEDKPQKIEEETTQALFQVTQLAAETGDGEALFKLGAFCEMGSGIPQNISKAIGLYYQAANKGNEFAKTRLSLLFKTKDSNVVRREHKYKSYYIYESGHAESFDYDTDTDTDIDIDADTLYQVFYQETVLGLEEMRFRYSDGFSRIDDYEYKKIEQIQNIAFDIDRCVAIVRENIENEWFLISCLKDIRIAAGEDFVKYYDQFSKFSKDANLFYPDDRHKQYLFLYNSGPLFDSEFSIKAGEPCQKQYGFCRLKIKRGEGIFYCFGDDNASLGYALKMVLESEALMDFIDDGRSIRYRLEDNLKDLRKMAGKQSECEQLEKDIVFLKTARACIFRSLNFISNLVDVGLKKRNELFMKNNPYFK